MVVLVPSCGSPRTKLWYFEYQTVVFEYQPLAFHIFLGEENHIFTYLCQSIKHGNKWKALKNKINIQPHCGGSTTRVEQNTASNLPYRLLTVAAVRGRNRRDYLLPGGKLDDTGRNRTRHPAAVHPSDKVPQQPVPPQRLSGKRAEVNRQELAALDYDTSCFDAGEEFVDPAHLYAYDLDVFGTHSLFQYVNRTCTEPGKRLLANWLGQHLERKRIYWNDRQPYANWLPNCNSASTSASSACCTKAQQPTKPN